MNKLIIGTCVVLSLAGCKSVEIITETTEKTFDTEKNIVSEKTIKTTQKDESFTFGFSEGSNKQINIIPLDISVVK
jgi:uncharacterized protein YceK